MAEKIKVSSVSLAAGYGRAYVCNFESRGEQHVQLEGGDCVEMTPKQARRLAAALIKHADLAEAKDSDA